MRVVKEMKYISKQPNPNGAYPPIFEGYLTPLPDSLAVWPDNLSTEAFYAYNGFIILGIENGTVASYEPNIDAWEAWKTSLQPDEPVLTIDPVAQLRADMDYLAALQGVIL